MPQTVGYPAYPYPQGDPYSQGAPHPGQAGWPAPQHYPAMPPRAPQHAHAGQAAPMMWPYPLPPEGWGSDPTKA